MNNPYWTWRRRAKLSALILPYGLAAISHQSFTVFASVLFVVALVVDFIRFSIPRFNQKYLEASSFTKLKETRRLSGYSLFLLSTTILFWLFPTNIAVVALTFFILSDLVAPVIGQRWLTREIINHKTWGGAVGILIVCLLTGYVLNQILPFTFSLPFLLAAAVSVAVLDLCSFILDDNLLVPLGTALILLVLF